MSEFPTITLVLGLIGTVTGIIALLISYWTYRKEKPNLEVEVLSSTHNFTPTADNGKHINFWLKFRLKNLGDRGTRINDIGLHFRMNNAEYDLKAQQLNELLPNGNCKVGPKWLEAHDSVIIHADFYRIYDGTEAEKIGCTFTVFHTHGSYDFKTASTLKRLPHLGNQ
jgi:hypothetical protein